MRSLNEDVLCLCLGLLQLLPLHIWERQSTASLPSLQGFLCLPIHPDLTSLAPATELLNLSPGKSSYLHPCPVSATSPLLPPAIFCSCSTSQQNFWASPLPFPNTIGRITNSTNQHCLTRCSLQQRKIQNLQP